jgi:hypothetical protein
MRNLTASRHRRQDERTRLCRSNVAYNGEKGEVKIANEGIRANMALLIFVGSELTSTAMLAILIQFLQTSCAMTRVTEKVRFTFENEDELTIASVAKLEYLTAEIQEGI